MVVSVLSENQAVALHNRQVGLFACPLCHGQQYGCVNLVRQRPEGNDAVGSDKLGQTHNGFGQQPAFGATQLIAHGWCLTANLAAQGSLGLFYVGWLLLLVMFHELNLLLFVISRFYHSLFYPPTHKPLRHSRISV